MQWTEKYRPKKFIEIQGQSEAVQKVKEFVGNFNPELGGNISFGKTRIVKKAILLNGPAGTGKTSIAISAANETNSEIFELNASDFRNKEKIQLILKPAIEQQSLFKKNKLILIDEVDGLSGYYDRGGMQELLRLIQETNYPIIMTANKIWDSKFSPLRKVSEIIELKPLDYKSIKETLIEVLRKEKLFIQNEILTKLAIKAQGDLRAAINDLQTISKLENPEIQEFDERNKETDIFNILRILFKENPYSDLIRLFDSSDLSLDEILLWIEENIPQEYKQRELARATQALSNADLFRGRIYKKQYWRFLVYQNLFLSYGISAAKDIHRVDREKFTKYRRPMRILKIWMNNQKTAKKKSIAEKYASHCHIGKKRAMSEFPIIKEIIKSNQKIQDELKLDEEEIGYLIEN